MAWLRVRYRQAVELFHDDKRDGLWITERLLHKCGVWQIDASNGLQMIHIVFLGLSTGMICSHTYSFFINWNDSTKSLEALFTLVVSMCINTFIWVFATKQAQLQDIMRYLRGLQTPEQKDDENKRQIRDRSDKIAKLFPYILGITCINAVITAIFVFLPYGYVNRKFIHGIWTPYDQTKTPFFEISLVFFTLLDLTLLTVSTPTLSYTLCFFVYVIAQFKILRYNLSNLRQRSRANIRREDILTRAAAKWMQLAGVGMFTKVKRRFASKVTQYLGPSVNVDSSRNRRPKKKSQVVGQRRSEMSLRRAVVQEVVEEDGVWEEKRKMRFQREMDRLLGDCVKHHQALIDLVGDFESTLQYVYQIALIAHLITCGSCATYIMSLPALHVEHLMVATFFILLSIIVFVADILSQMITDESELVREAAYGTEWYSATDGFKRSIRIIMSRANQPVVITVAGFVPCNLDTFVYVTRLTYNFFQVGSNLEP